MRPTERTRTPQAAPAPRPAERMFTTRELLKTSWDERFKMSAADQVSFGYARTVLRLQLHNSGRSFDTAGATDLLAREAIQQAEIRRQTGPVPEMPATAAPFVAPDVGLANATPWPRRRRHYFHAPG